MQLRWFRRFGWVYRPVSAIGWGITIITAALIVNVFLAVDRHSHSASDTLWGVFPYAVCFLVLANWVASHTCGEAVPR
ncbi:MAG TPA: hypothetical protein VGI81_06205 [Tepidisphaeraceae bacterium]|jgi:hypothetical protein